MWDGQKISLVIPAYNEEKGIGLTLNEFNKPPIDEIVVIDNNSTDNTGKIARKNGAIVYIEKHQGYGAAIKRGMAEATGDIIVIIEGDNSFSFQDLHHFLSLLPDNDLIIGSRTNPEVSGNNPYFSAILRLGNRVFGKIANVLYPDLDLTDVGCTYRILRKDLNKKLVKVLNADGPEFSIEMIIKATKLKARINEIPVKYKVRMGVSKNSPSFYKVIRNGLSMLWVIFSNFL